MEVTREDAQGEAVRWAEHLRRTRTAIAEEMGSHGCELGEVLDCRHRADIGVVYLQSVLEAVPGVRRIDARRALSRMELDGFTRLTDLSDADVASILAEFANGGCDHG